MKKLRYFSQWDFDNVFTPCSIDDMDFEFLKMLDKARHISGELAEANGEKCIYKLTSAYRTVEHELSRGRKGTSSHANHPCNAVDITATTSRQRFYIAKGLILAGFERIGFHFEKGFIHVDSSTNKGHHPRLIFSY